ncbi:MAG: MBL fold metallo-hydrolase [Bryobacteraceae bacterium]|jgi:beta-lactamase superfamily II metal-dependent hydrolase
MRFTMFCVLLASLAGLPRAYAAKPMEIYFIDVEGGQATLIVSPSGQSLLVDTGWRGFNGRDAERIVKAAKNSHVKELNYVLITHYHTDHVGGAMQIADRMKIGTFVDHGPNTEDTKVVREDFKDYQAVLARTQHLVVKPGDEIPIKGIKVQVVAAAGQHIEAPLAGAGQPNQFCGSEPAPPDDPTENAASAGILVTYDNFRFLDLGDLTKKKELGLVCPNNLIGAVDVYLTTHHGLDQSNGKTIVDALHPRVAIMNNGDKKGGSPSAWQIVHDSPGLEGMWQLHYALAGGKEHNVPDAFIANIDSVDDGHYIKLTAEPNGTFTVYNTRNKNEKTYTK